MNPLLSLADHRFVSLTTFRRSGAPVSTPVWVGRDGGSLVVLTPVGSGKVKRLRHDPRVELRPCGRFGAVADGVEPMSAIAEVREADADVVRARATIRRAYPIESRIVLGIERLVERLRGRPGPPARAAPHPRVNRAGSCAAARGARLLPCCSPTRWRSCTGPPSS